ncbi:polysaccharide pyruvyl transferase CsaB [Caldalkalibacillus salinus]|uniref:polysaccharide pyruvyl transferase CsaB n=1 Tax=Caldalkalibacillus salinus TaxID=2803787 RepID=UPI0019227B87|nr:polysaccharide pyruvyl transferase CsaB [Caldalkalibacillus salinus]
MEDNKIKIMLSGYFGYDNAGDEAILSSVIQAIRTVAEEPVTFVVLSGNPEQTENVHRVKAIHRTDLKTIWAELKDTAIFISGGGSLLQDKTSPRTIPYYLAMIHLAQLAHVPVAVYAQGIGPVQRKIFHKWIATTLKRVQYISVRDPKSKALLVDWKLPEQKVAQVVDPVLLMSTDGIESATRLLARENITLNAPPIMFSIRQWAEGDQDLKVVAQTCDALIEQGEEVLMVPMHYPEDAQVACEILSYMNHRAHILQEPYTPQELSQIVSAGKLMVGMRLHALIFATAQDVPCLGLSYDPKIDAFMNMLGQDPIARAGHLAHPALLEAIEEAIDGLPDLEQKTQAKAKQLRDQALIPAKQVVKMLNSHSVK